VPSIGWFRNSPETLPRGGRVSTTREFRNPPGHRHPAGFTLLEMTIVLAVLGMVLGLAVSRGPMRSQTMEMQGAVNAVAQGLRIARSRAIANNTPVRFAIDIPLHGFRIGSERPIVLPRSVTIAVVAVSEETLGNRLAAIRFNGDGSATGGRIELADGQHAAYVGVDWLTGRISVVQTH
jgi:general secretion pathway protein H